MKDLLSITIAAVMLLSTVNVSAQDLKKEFYQLLKEKDNEKVEQLLTKWEAQQPNAADMFIAYFNYYNTVSKQNMLYMSETPSREENLVIQDDDKTVAYLKDTTITIDSLYDLALVYINKGLKVHPYRLDMYFGKIYSLREAGRYAEHTAELLKMIETIKADMNGAWKWSNDEPITNIEERLIGSVRDYVYALFDLDVPYYVGIKKISNAMLKHYPDNVVFISYLGAVAMSDDNVDEALRLYMKAHNIDPEDGIVLGNIAYIYTLKGENEKAIEFYDKMIATGDPDFVEFAEKEIAELRK